MACDTYGGGHTSLDFSIIRGAHGHIEQVDFAGNALRQQVNPNSGMYNPGWWNHPNFSLGSQRQQQKPLPGFRPCQQNDKGLHWRRCSLYLFRA